MGAKLNNDTSEILKILLDMQKQVGLLSVEVAFIKSRLESGDKEIIGSKSSIMRISDQIRALPCNKTQTPCNSKEESQLASLSAVEAISQGAAFVKNSPIIQKLIWSGVGAVTCLIVWIIELVIKYVK